LDKLSSSVGCRSPPISFVFELLQNETEDIKMSNNHEKKHVLRVNGELHSVDDETYLYYYKSKRRMKYLIESDLVHGKVSYHDLDTDEISGEEMIPDFQAESIEDSIIQEMMIEKLNKSIEMLSEDERWLIDELFYQAKSEGEIGGDLGITQQAISKRIEKFFIN
jgi:DNA-directed RNA polymerase specialized sigma24 family protein